MGKEGVLLGLVEPVHLVDEEHRSAPGRAIRPCGVYRAANVPDAGEHRG